MHRLTLAWLCAQRCWGGEVCRSSQAWEAAGQGKLTGLPSWGLCAALGKGIWAEGGERGAFPPTRSPQRKMRATLS